MKKALIIAICCFCMLTSFGQKKIAIIESNDESEINMPTIIYEIISTGITNSGKYISIEKSVIDKVLSENKTIVTRNTDNSTISELGKQMGADYICFLLIKKMTSDFFLTAKLINVSTASVELQKYVKTENGKDDLVEKIDELTVSLFTRETIKIQNNPIITKSLLIDSRDGREYKVVQIGNQKWMAENLNYTDATGFCYNDNIYNCIKYGKLYSWEIAKNVCPNGWHLPSNEEWQILINTVGGKEIAGKMLKSQGGWTNNGDGVDMFGFKAIPGGSCNLIGRFDKIGAISYWWSSTESSSTRAYLYWISDRKASILSLGFTKDWYFSVRCVNNE